MEKRLVYFKNIDAVRFIAAMFVFLQHAFLPISIQFRIDNPLLSKFIALITNGGIGVSLFFVLSGFLLTYLILTEVEVTGKLNLKNFYIRRFLRIWPLYFAVVIFWFVIFTGVKSLFGFNSPLNSNFFMHLTFLSNFNVLRIYQAGQGVHGMFQNINWSVSIEEQFYLFWPLIFILPKKSWLVVIVALGLFSLGFRYVNVDVPYVNYLHTFSVLIDLVMGGLFAYMVKSQAVIHSYFENTNTYSHFVVLTITFLMLLFGTDQIFGLYANPFGRLISSFLFAFFIASQALTKNSSFLNFGNLKFATKWGGFTYGIYLLHPIAIKFLDLACRYLNLDYRNSFWTESAVAIIVFGLTLAMSKFSFTYLEIKFLRFKNKYQTIKSH